MSLDKNRHEAGRWLQTAKEDIQAAQVLPDGGFYAHACFLAQQCAEKAVKSMWFFLDKDPRGTPSKGWPANSLNQRLFQILTNGFKKQPI